MLIKKINVENFKSFEKCEIHLNKLNILIGGNASGKSNFVQIFRFLKDIMRHGAEDAIAMQGGSDYIRNINLDSRKLSIGFVAEGTPQSQEPFGPFRTFPRLQKLSYNFTIEFHRRGEGFEVIEDILRFDGDVVETSKKKSKEINIIGTWYSIVSNIEGKINSEFDTSDEIKEYKRKSKNTIFGLDERLFKLFDGKKIPQNSLLLGPQLPFILVSRFSLIEEEYELPFLGISIYDFDPHLSKKPTPFTGRAELEEDGSNLAVILRSIIKNREQYKKFSNIVSSFLPFAENWNTETLPDKSMFFNMSEKYSKNKYLPASFISDGTINTVALILSLYFSKTPINIIEEPERNIHPSLIFKIVEMMKDASNSKQIIVTTHNPLTVKYMDVENLLLVTRNKKGFSTISRPSDSKEVKIFLKNEIGLDELHIKNFYEIGNNRK